MYKTPVKGIDRNQTMVTPNFSVLMLPWWLPAYAYSFCCPRLGTLISCDYFGVLTWSSLAGSQLRHTLLLDGSNATGSGIVVFFFFFLLRVVTYRF